MGGTQYCLDVENRPPTPDGVRRYRKTFHSEPGTRIVHYGLIQDMAKQDKFKKYGVTSDKSDHVEDIFANLPMSAMAEYKMEQAENIYDSRKKEPLGVSYSRKHVLPQQTENPEFAFGIPSGSSDDAKELMYPRPDSDGSQHKQQYIKSHGSYEPAEQRNRNYAWSNTQVKDPANFRFGKGADRPEANGVGMCLDNAKDPSVPKTRITNAAVERFKATKDHLGRTRNLGNGPVAGQTGDHTFGVGGTVDAWGAKKCIEGEYCVNEQMPDDDLGRATQIGWRNFTKETRSFGCPTVRTDLRCPQGRGIADCQNYGDDTSAAFLIQPDQYACMGLDDDAFAEAMSQQDIRQMFDEIGYDWLGDEEFGCIWNQAAQRSLSRPGDVSVGEFRDCLNDYLDAKEDGELAGWMQRTAISY